MVTVRAPRVFSWAIVSVALVPCVFEVVADEPERSSLIETATVRARPLDRITAAVTVLERDEIEALGVTSVAELIRFLPGMDVTSSGPRGGLATAQIRGGDPNFTVVLVDGVPLNDTTDQLGGAVNLAAISTALVERIEVVRGPLSSDYGSTGLAGVINIVTRRGSAAGRGFSFHSAAGSDDVFAAGASLHGGNSRSNHLVGATWEQEEDRVVRDRFDQFGLQGNLTAELPNRAEVRVSGRASRSRTDDYPDASGGPRLGTGETRHAERDEMGLAVEWRLGRDASRQHRVYGRAFRHEQERTSPGVPPGVSGFVPPSVERTVFDSLRMGWAAPQLARGALRSTLGAEVGLERGRNDSTLFLPPQFGGPTDGSYEDDRAVVGVFAEVLAERGPALYELTVRVDIPQDFDPQFSPRFGAVFRLPGGSTRLRAAAGRGFKLPSFFARSSPAVIGGNPDLEPEIVVGFDAGVEHAFRKAGLDVILTIFHNRFEDLIDFDFATFQNVNRASVVTRGVELSVGWKPTARLTLRGAATAVDIENEETGLPLRQRPRRVGGARVIWEPIERLRWEFDGQWVSERFDEQIPVGPSSVAGYPLFGTALSFELGRAWQVHARVDNLADRSYETFLGFPGPDRAFRAGLRYRSGPSSGS